MTFDPFVVAVALLYGLMFGSFANVCIYRLPRDKSIVWPRSACPGCGREIAWYDNFPVLSFLILLGRCRFCRIPISPRYPFVELTVGTLAALAFARHPGQWMPGISEALFGWLLVILIFTDLDHQILPDLITLGGTLAGLALAFGRGGSGPRDAVIGVFAGGGIIWVIRRSYEFIRKREGMGFGDVKMLAMIGAFQGWHGVVVSLVLGSLAGAIVGLVLFARGKSMRTTQLPFGVFLGLGALFGEFAGEKILRIYGL